MLNEKELRALILIRWDVLETSGSAFHRNHVTGQIKALIYVLSGETPPILRDFEQLLIFTNIPYTVEKDSEGEEWAIIPDAWLSEHGFVTGLGKFTEGFPHTDPNFGKGW